MWQFCIRTADFLDGISFDLDDDAQNSEHMDLPSCSGNSSDSCTSDFCNSPSRKNERTTSTCSVFKSTSNKFDVAEDCFFQHIRLPQKDSKKIMQTSTYKVFKSASNEFDGNYFDENYRVPKKDLKNNVQQTKPRRKRQNISRRPGETDAQLKERRYQAKLRRNRESGKRARKRRKDTVGTLKLEQEQLLEQIHTKLLIVKRLEQQNEQLKQELIDEQAANHPLFNHNGSRARDRRYQVCLLWLQRVDHVSVRLERGARDNDHCIFLKLSLIQLTLFPSILSAGIRGTSPDNIRCRVCCFADLVGGLGVLLPVWSAQYWNPFPRQDFPSWCPSLSRNPRSSSSARVIVAVYTANASGLLACMESFYTTHGNFHLQHVCGWVVPIHEVVNAQGQSALPLPSSTSTIGHQVHACVLHIVFNQKGWSSCTTHAPSPCCHIYHLNWISNYCMNSFICENGTEENF